MTDNSMIDCNNVETNASAQPRSSFRADLSHRYGLLRFSGDDAQTFLQGQLTCDMRTITAEQASYGSYCSPKGRVLANFVLWQYDQSYFMQLPLSLCESIHKKLSLYKLRAKVTIENVSQDYHCTGVVGPETSNILSQLVESLPDLSRSLQFIANDKIGIVYLAADRVQIVTTIQNSASISEILNQSVSLAGINDWERLAIHAGIPVILPQTQEAFLPQMINLDAIGGLSFKKGCYPGQEIVARTRYLGKLKRRMYLCFIVKADKSDTVNTVNPGDSLYSSDMPDQACGSIVNAVKSFDNGFDVLAVIQQSSIDDGEIHYGSLQGPVLQIKPLPYSLP